MGRIIAFAAEFGPMEDAEHITPAVLTDNAEACAGAIELAAAVCVRNRADLVDLLRIFDGGQVVQLEESLETALETFQATADFFREALTRVRTCKVELRLKAA